MAGRGPKRAVIAVIWLGLVASATALNVFGVRELLGRLELSPTLAVIVEVAAIGVVLLLLPCWLAYEVRDLAGERDPPRTVRSYLLPVFTVWNLICLGVVCFFLGGVPELELGGESWRVSESESEPESESVSEAPEPGLPEQPSAGSARRSPTSQESFFHDYPPVVWRLKPGGPDTVYLYIGLDGNRSGVLEPEEEHGYGLRRRRGERDGHGWGYRYGAASANEALVKQRKARMPTSLDGVSESCESDRVVEVEIGLDRDRDGRFDRPKSEWDVRAYARLSLFLCLGEVRGERAISKVHKVHGAPY